MFKCPITVSIDHLIFTLQCTKQCLDDLARQNDRGKMEIILKIIQPKRLWMSGADNRQRFMSLGLLCQAFLKTGGEALVL